MTTWSSQIKNIVTWTSGKTKNLTTWVDKNKSPQFLLQQNGYFLLQQNESKFILTLLGGQYINWLNKTKNLSSWSEIEKNNTTWTSSTKN